MTGLISSPDVLVLDYHDVLVLAYILDVEVVWEGEMYSFGQVRREKVKKYKPLEWHLKSGKFEGGVVQI